MPNVPKVSEGLNGHDRPMHETGPNREPDKAFVGHRISRGNYQEHAERGIHTEDHLKVLRATVGVPRPVRRPDNREWGEAKNEYQSYDQQSNTQIFDAIRFSDVSSSFGDQLTYWTSLMPCHDHSIESGMVENPF